MPRYSLLNEHVPRIREFILMGLVGEGLVSRIITELGVPTSTTAVQNLINRNASLKEARQKAARTRVPPTQDETPVDDPQRMALGKAQQAERYWKRRAGELDRALVNRETIIERIIEAARVPVEPLDFPVLEQDEALPVRSAVIPIYDVQYGQLVQPTDTPLGMGNYSDAVFRERLARWVDGVTRSLRDYSASHRVTELIIPLGGDLVEGADIFAGQAWQLEKDPARQARELAAHLATGIGKVIEVARTELGVARTMITFVPGNHGKVGGRRAGAIPATMSWDWLCVEFLKLEMQKYPVDVWGLEPAGALLFETAGHLFLQIHGDEIRGWGGLPFYGLTRYDGRAIRLTGEVFDYCLLGHHHQPASIPNGSGGEFIVSGDWVGANNLSTAIVAASRPQQQLLFVAEKYGITEKVPIYFETERIRPHIYTAA